tara:strand:+ start:329 stop:1459 length:1131 start_codon:yes stop_codon:yes gene_type:complete
MSILKVAKIRGVSASSDAISVANDGTCTANITNNLSNRNLLINGDMQISQRNGTTSVAYTNAQYSLDRWQVVNDAGGSKFTTQQVDDAPVGFQKSLKMSSSSAYSVPADEVYGVGQKIEGFNTNPLMFGSSDAKSITISFFVKSSLTGTFSGSVLNQDMLRGYPWTYTISAANTWEYKTVTVAGSQDGTWLEDNREGIRIFWNMGSGTNRSGNAGQWSTAQYTFGATGATSVVGTNGATLQITGCQVEEGSVATDFEHRSFAQELALCQRYYQQSYEHGTSAGTSTNTNTIVWYPDATTNYASVSFGLPCVMRTQPTVTIYSSTGASGKIRNVDIPVDRSAYVVGNNNSFLMFAAQNSTINAANTVRCHYTANAEL